jgi:hypothetical protein
MEFEFIWNFKSDYQAVCIYTGVDYSSVANPSLTAVCSTAADRPAMQEGVAI